MKKLLYLLLPMMLMALTGCGPTAYEEFKEETSDLQNSSAILIETDLGNWDLLKSTFDFESKNIKLSNQKINKSCYTEALDNGYCVMGVQGDDNSWEYAYLHYNKRLNEIFEQNSNIAEVFPKDEEVFHEEFFNIPIIDNAIVLKKPQDILVKTADNTYTISGVEDQVTITTVDGVIKVTIIGDEETNYVTISATEPVSIPEEAMNLLDSANI